MPLTLNLSINQLVISLTISQMLMILCQVIFYSADGQRKSSFYPFSGVTEEFIAFINDIKQATLKVFADANRHGIQIMLAFSFSFLFEFKFWLADVDITKLIPDSDSPTFSDCVHCMSAEGNWL